MSFGRKVSKSMQVHTTTYDDQEASLGCEANKLYAPILLDLYWNRRASVSADRITDYQGELLKGRLWMRDHSIRR